MDKIAVIGAQNNLGREILSFLEAGGISAKDICAVGINAPMGTQVSYGEDDDLDVYNLDDFDFSKVNYAIFAISKTLAAKPIQKALAKNVKIIDLSKSFLSDQDVPTIIAGINDDAIYQAKKGIVSIPSAPVTQMLLPLAKINSELKIKRIILSTYTSTSIYGKEGMDELFNQTRKIFMNNTISDSQTVFNKQIAFNVIPQVGEFIEETTDSEEDFNILTKKILGDNILVHANCAVVPAFIGCGEYINVECEKEVDIENIRSTMKSTKGVIVFDKAVDGGYVTLNDVQGESDVYISRLRQDTSVKNGFSFWCVSDNLKASQNAFLVLKLLMNQTKKN